MLTGEGPKMFSVLPEVFPRDVDLARCDFVPAEREERPKMARAIREVFVEGQVRHAERADGGCACLRER